MSKALPDIEKEILAQLNSATGGTWSGEIRTNWNKAQKKVAQDLPDSVLGESLMGTKAYLLNITPMHGIAYYARPAGDLRVVSLMHVVATTGAYKAVKLVPTLTDLLAHQEISTGWVSGRATTFGTLEGGVLYVGPVAIRDLINERYVKQPADSADPTQLPDDIVPLAEDYACWLCLAQIGNKDATVYLGNYKAGVVDIFQRAQMEPPRAYVNRPEVT